MYSRLSSLLMNRQSNRLVATERLGYEDLRRLDSLRYIVELFDHDAEIRVEAEQPIAE